jgi:hypothetical protein
VREVSATAICVPIVFLLVLFLNVIVFSCHILSPYKAS